MRQLVNKLKAPFISACAYAALTRPAAAAEAASQPASAAAAAMQFSGGQLVIVLAIVALTTTLFFVLFIWQNRNEMAGYFGRLYRDTIENIETTRLAAPLHKKLAEGGYHQDILRQRTPEAQEWSLKHPRPAPADELNTLASALQRRSEVRAIERHMDMSGESGSRIGGLGSSSGTSNPFAARAEGPRAEQEQDQARRMDVLLEQFRQQAEDWIASVDAAAHMQFDRELAPVQKDAKERAAEAMSVDLSVLRGRGPEFVLEFTAVVVIIFSAVILGVLGILDSNQIGTLLAAIAGYVLGKGSSRARTNAAEGTPAQAPGKLEVSVAAAPPSPPPSMVKPTGADGQAG